MSTNVWSRWLRDNHPRGLGFSHRSGWFAFAEDTARKPLRRLSMAELSKLGEEEREDYDECRRIWNVNMPVIRTHQLTGVFSVLDQVMYSNARDGGRIKGGVAIDAPPGLGKTTIAATYARRFHRRQIRRLGERTAAGHQRVPVVFVSLAANMTLKSLNRQIVEFYGHPAIEKLTAAKLASLATEYAGRCETGLIVVDDLHFVDFRHRMGVEVSNHLKWLANELPVTFLYTGVGLASKAFFNEGMTGESAAMAQTARRTTLCPVEPFTITTDAGARAWADVLAAIEQHIILADARAGMLTDHAQLMFERTQGHIASLVSLVDRCCFMAISGGTETITPAMIRSTALDNAAARATA